MLLIILKEVHLKLLVDQVEYIEMSIFIHIHINIRNHNYKNYVSNDDHIRILFYM